VLRDPPALLSLAAGLAVARACGPGALIKWPNDVLVDGRKVAGILVEGRPQERWAVVGVGINAAVDLAVLPAELADRAGSLGLAAAAIEPLLERLLAELERTLALDPPVLLGAYRRRDALAGATVAWAGGRGRAAGIDDDGLLIVELGDGSRVRLAGGEIHLTAT
jgi:BirA family biotin operon repressor/biotin-[acetyl-CoA-carboxylase] ligase